MSFEFVTEASIDLSVIVLVRYRGSESACAPVLSGHACHLGETALQKLLYQLCDVLITAQDLSELFIIQTKAYFFQNLFHRILDEVETL